MTAFELAKLYYPRLWPKARLDTLRVAGKLTQEEYDQLTAPVKEEVTNE